MPQSHSEISETITSLRGAKLWHGCLIPHAIISDKDGQKSDP